MVMTEWMKSVKEALKTIPKNTPNRLGAAMKKAKLTYKKGSSASSSSSSSNVMMKKTFKHRKSHKGRKGSRKSKHHSRRKGHRGGAMSKLNPADVDVKGTSGVDIQLGATNRS
jgi:hypothetical protein